MKYLDEYRDGEAAKTLTAAIARIVTRPWTLMEVCGGQTHTIVKYGIDRILPPEPGATSGRQRADKSFHELLERAKIRDFRFHDLRHTFASWYMMSGGDLYELSKLLGHSNIKMTERYADLARAHIVKTGSVSRELWSRMEPQSERGGNDVAPKKIGHRA